MAATREYYNQDTPQYIKDPRYLPVFRGNQFQMPSGENTMSTGHLWTSASTTFWSYYQQVGTYMSQSNSSWATIIDISGSSKRIALCGIIGPWSNSTTSQAIRITVDGTVYTLAPNVAQSSGLCWGTGFDYTANTYGGSTRYRGQSKRFGGEYTYQATGDVHTSGTLYITGCSPMSVGETIAQGAPVLVAESSLKVENYGSVPTGYPYMYGFRGCQWAYLPA